MALLIGTDEAGYGPNLGPLVIAATMWEVPDDVVDRDLYVLLRDGVAVQPNPTRLAVADSKLLYKPRGSLAGLECGVYAAQTMLDSRPTTWRSVWSALAADSCDSLTKLPWYGEFDCSLPLDANFADLSCLEERFCKACSDAGVRLLGQQATAIFPGDFNKAVDQLGSKGTLLTAATLALVRNLLPPDSGEDVFIGCDKHGGRSKYGPSIEAAFGASWVDVVSETRSESHYQLALAGQRLDIRFRVRGESFLPSALASMTAKYLRELAMKAFNQFWASHMANLQPTAGYPQDAKRFRGEVMPLLKKMKIDERDFWRSR